MEGDNFVKIKYNEIVLPACCVVFVSAFPSLFLYFQNADEAGISEVLPIMFASSTTGLLLFFIIASITHKFGKAGVVVALLMATFLNFADLEALIKQIAPNMKYWNTVPIIIIISLHLAFFIWKVVNNEMAKDITIAVCFAFGGLIIINCVAAAPNIIDYIHNNYNRVDEDVEHSSSADTSLPNVYLIIFDEYASFNQMEDYYNYTNQELIDYLDNRKFQISYTSRNDSTDSGTVQTNMMNLDYIVSDATSSSEKRALRENGELFKILKAHGYEIEFLERDDNYGGHVPGKENENVTGAVTISGESMTTLLINKSILYPFINDQTSLEIITDYQTIIDYMISNADQVQNKFTLGYFCFPHQPFIVDENGKAIEVTSNWGDTKYYLGQYKYATKMIMNLAEGIISKDPNAVLMIMSDHGARGGGGFRFPVGSKNNIV